MLDMRIDGVWHHTHIRDEAALDDFVVTLGGLLSPERKTSVQLWGLELLMRQWLGSNWREIFPEIPTVSRSDKSVAKWRRDVLARDGHACVRCGATDKLHVHHIVHWSTSPESRTKIDNGETLCKPCHAGEHPELSVLRR